jgi:hypothetical protein
MAFTDALDVVIGAATRASDYDSLADNTEFNREKADAEHDFDISTGDGKHKRIQFDADNTRDIGSASARAKDLYIGGSVYLGGTGAANALDDYEEGTWTAGLTAGSGTITPVTSQDLMRYTKVGNLVTVMGDVRVNSVSSPSGALTITGLPFTVSTGLELEDRTACTVNLFGLTGTINAVQGQVDAASTGISILEFDGTTTAAMADHIQASTEIIINMTYTAA